jgi:predicted kinase
MAENILYIMTGLPYSGKTTLVKKLVKKIKCKVVSVDEILEQKDLWKEKHPSQSDWETAYSEACKKVENYLIDRENVIFDESNLLYVQRESLRKMAESLEIKTKLIYVKIDRKEALKRWEKNLETKEKNQLSKDIMERTFNIFEEPKPNEEAVIYNQNTDFKKWIKLEIKHQ